jgi:LysR family transcriptional regulator, low CO2-responsive transcriptional regulator
VPPVTAPVNSAISEWLSADAWRPRKGFYAPLVTLAQLKVFVLVARLGTVRGAAAALGVSEPAVSQALTALRQQLDDPLMTRLGSSMELTPAGRRLVPIASQMVNLAIEAEQAVRQSKGAAELVRVVTTSTLSQSVAPALLETFSGRSKNVEINLAVSSTQEMEALVHERMADIALGPRLASLDNEPVMRYRLVLVAGAGFRPRGPLAAQQWLVGPTGTDPASDVGRLLAAHAVPESSVRVFVSDAAAWLAATTAEGVAPAVDHLVAADVERGALVRLAVPGMPIDGLWYVNSLPGDRRSVIATKLRRFMQTPEATQAMYRADGGVPVSRFRPPVHVTIWS